MDRHCISCDSEFDENWSDEGDWNDPTICPNCGSDYTYIYIDKTEEREFNQELDDGLYI